MGKYKEPGFIKEFYQKKQWVPNASNYFDNLDNGYNALSARTPTMRITRH